jgi:vancomycin resistance protein YoaR
LLCVAALAVAAFRPHEVELSRYATTLEGRTRAQKHNAWLALSRLNGAIVEPGKTFSFNAKVGSFSRDQGYRKAPVSYNGQLIDSWGGGVCQASTTLYNAALLSGMEIVERNRHRFAPSYVPPGRDAAVAFNSIDLRFRNPHPYPVRIACTSDGKRIEVTLWAEEALRERPEIYSEIREVREPALVMVGAGGRHARVRNTGKAGWDVTVYRTFGDRKELISSDSYPAMARIVQTR